MKQKRFQKLTSLILVAVMIASLLPAIPVTVNAADNGTWALVTDENTLAVNDIIIIAAKDSEVAMSTNQKTSNRGQASITKNGNALSEIADDVQQLTLKEGTIDGTFAFYTDSGYLYAASSSYNYLKTQTTLNDNGSWDISIDSDGTASIVAQGTNTRNTLQYYSSSSLFACYASATQKAVVLYKWVESSGGEETQTETETETETLTETETETETETKTETETLTETETETETKTETETETETESEAPTPDAPEKQYIKVTQTPTDWSGTYLIVYEAGNLIFDGSLQTIDVAQNKLELTTEINDGVIEGNYDAYAFTIEKMDGGYSIKSASGYYIGSDASSSTYEIDTSDESPLLNDIQIENGNVIITGTGGHVLRYNSTSNQSRFRYYSNTGTQKAIALYRLDDGSVVAPCEHTECTYYQQREATCQKTGYAQNVYQCNTCSVYLDETKENVLSAGDVILDIVDHDYIDRECRFGCGSTQTAYIKIYSTDSLKAGDKILIVAAEEDFAIGAFKTNNFDQSPVTKKNNLLLANETALVVTLEEVDGGLFAFFTGEKYLYAASSENNYLKTQQDLDQNGHWNIKIDPETGIATIQAQGDNTHNLLRYNSSNDIFSCYAEDNTTQKDVVIYKLGEYDEPDLTTYQVSLTETVNVKVAYTITSQWLADHPGATIEFNNTTTNITEAKTYSFSVNLTPGRINEDLKIVIRSSDSLIISERDVSIASYKKAIEKLGSAQFGSTYEPLMALLDAIVAYGTAAKNMSADLGDPFENVDNYTKNDTAELFGMIYSTLSESASIMIGVNTEKDISGYNLAVTRNGNAIINGALSEKLVDGKIVINDFFPSEFDKENTITITDGENTVATATFTFDQYLKALYNNSNEYKGIAAATYNYGVAARAYKEASK